MKESLPVLVVLALLALPGTAAAHAIGAEAKLRDGRVHVEGYFDDDSPAASARVWVENEAQEKVAEGRTDARGRWAFDAPPPGRYRVIVDAGAGHRATVNVTIPAVPQTTPTVPAGTVPPSPDRESVQVSDGPSRAEFTSIPWLRVGIGLVAIALLALGVPLIRRALRASATKRETP